MRFEKFYDPQSAISFRIGGNFANRKDFSPYNENEKGNGFGAGIGYNRYLNLKKGKIVLAQIPISGTCGFTGATISGNQTKPIEQPTHWCYSCG
ncbi:MAG TPA: hypothetical protein VHP12_06715 [Chitinophagaceae bacterium]|nr:hypothetical protein [Chitinophagaceae bacterium]